MFASSRKDSDQHDDDQQETKENRDDYVVFHFWAERCGSRTAAEEEGRAQKEYTNPGKVPNAKRGRRLGTAVLFVSDTFPLSLFLPVLKGSLFRRGPLPQLLSDSPQPLGMVLVGCQSAACLKLLCVGGEYVSPWFLHVSVVSAS
ncbi:MAG: hypothetical protein DME23_26825 [Verrucomicrobia bacterium]|nr:MAG: hypothetical protein DME23_26825 [Verrucomicrobiota bacterium]